MHFSTQSRSYKCIAIGRDMGKFATCAKPISCPNRWRLPTSRRIPRDGDKSLQAGGRRWCVDTKDGKLERSLPTEWVLVRFGHRERCCSQMFRELWQTKPSRLHVRDFRVLKVVIINIFLQFRAMKANEQTVSGAGYFHRPRLLRTRRCSLASDTHEENTTSA